MSGWSQRAGPGNGAASDAADAVAEAWGVKGTPGLFLADAKGRVVFDRLRIALDQLLPPSPSI